MWTELGKAKVILFTANSTVTERGHLVMGGGAALQAKMLVPSAPEAFGQYLISNNLINKKFDLMILENDKRTIDTTGTIIGAFQTKYEVWKPSEYKYVIDSVDALAKVCGRYNKVVLNMPGIGLGGLERERVLPLLKDLPDNVIIYEYPQSP